MYIDHDWPLPAFDFPCSRLSQTEPLDKGVRPNVWDRAAQINSTLNFQAHIQSQYLSHYKSPAAMGKWQRGQPEDATGNME